MTGDMKVIRPFSNAASKKITYIAGNIDGLSGPAPTILDWYGHCVRVSVNNLGGLGACSPRKIFKISHSEIASEAMFGTRKKLLEL